MIDIRRVIGWLAAWLAVFSLVFAGDLIATGLLGALAFALLRKRTT